MRVQATKKKQSASPGRHSSKGAKWRSPRGRGRQSPRGRHAASTRRGDSPEPSGKPVHRDSGRASQNGPGKAAERHSDTRLQRQHSSGDRYSPIRRSSSAGRSAKQARLSRTPPQGSSASEASCSSLCRGLGQRSPVNAAKPSCPHNAPACPSSLQTCTCVDEWPTAHRALCCAIHLHLTRRSIQLVL